MKILTTMSNKEFILEDDEAENIVQLLNSKQSGFIHLRCGAIINKSSIATISDVPLVPSVEGHIVYGNYYYRDGQKIYIEDFQDVKMIPDPKYNVYHQQQDQFKKIEKWQKTIQNQDAEKEEFMALSPQEKAKRALPFFRFTIMVDCGEDPTPEQEQRFLERAIAFYQDEKNKGRRYPDVQTIYGKAVDKINRWSLKIINNDIQQQNG